MANPRLAGRGFKKRFSLVSPRGDSLYVRALLAPKQNTFRVEALQCYFASIARNQANCQPVSNGELRPLARTAVRHLLIL
ncbi:MAG: hypothetical protein ACK56I_26975 [bacterium]